MNLVKRFSALLVAVMAFTFIGTSIAPVDAQAASLTIQPHSSTSYVTGYAGMYDFNVIGKTGSLEFEVRGLTAGKRYQITTWYTTALGRYNPAPRVDFLDSMNVTFTANSNSQKIKLDKDDIVDSYYEYDTYLKVGYYNVTITDFTNASTSANVTFNVTGDSDDGIFNDTYRGVASIGPGEDYVYMVHYGSYQMKKISHTDEISVALTDLGPAISNAICYKIEYCDMSVHSFEYGFDRDIYRGSGSTNSVTIPGSYNPASTGSSEFKPGMYRVSYYNGVSDQNTLIAEAYLWVTGDSSPVITKAPTPTASLLGAYWSYTDNGTINANGGTAVYTNASTINLHMMPSNMTNYQRANIVWILKKNGTIVADGVGPDAVIDVTDTTLTPVNGNFPAGTYTIIATLEGRNLISTTCTVNNTATVTPRVTPVITSENWYFTDDGTYPSSGYIPSYGHFATYTDKTRIDFMLRCSNLTASAAEQCVTWTCFNGDEFVAQGTGLDADIFLSSSEITPVNGNFPSGHYIVYFYYYNSFFTAAYCDVINTKELASSQYWFYSDQGDSVPGGRYVSYTDKNLMALAIFTPDESFYYEDYLSWTCTYNGEVIKSGTGSQATVNLVTTTLSAADGKFPAGRYDITFTYTNGSVTKEVYSDYCVVIKTAAPTPYVDGSNCKWYFTDNGTVTSRQVANYTDKNRINHYLTASNFDASEYSNVTWVCTLNDAVVANGRGRDADIFVTDTTLTPVGNNFPEGRYYITYYYQGQQIFRDWCNVYNNFVPPTITPYVNTSAAKWYYTDTNTVSYNSGATYTDKNMINFCVSSVINLPSSEYSNLSWRCQRNGITIATGSGNDAMVYVSQTTSAAVNENFQSGTYTIIFSYQGRELIRDNCTVLNTYVEPTGPVASSFTWTGVYNNSTGADYDALYLNTKYIDLQVFVSNSGSFNSNNITWTCERVGFSGNMATGRGLHAVVNASNAAYGTLLENDYFRRGNYKITFYYNGVKFFSSTANVGMEPTLTPTPTNTNTPTPTVFVPTVTDTPTPTSTPTPTLMPGVESAVWYDIDGNVVPDKTYMDTTFIELDTMFSNVSSVTYSCFYNNSIIIEGASNVAAINIARTNIAASNSKFPVGDYTIVYYGPDGNVIFEDTCRVVAPPTVPPTVPPTEGPTITPVTPTPETLRCFVTRCYTECLGRDYDVAGHDYWEHCLSGAFNGCDVAKEFFFSDEFVNARHSNEEFVRRLYRTFMDRDPEPEGFQFWMNCLNNGSSRLDIFYGFINSPEWRDICAVYGSCINSSIRSGGYVMPQGVSISASNQTIAFVARLYSEGLGRDPEGPGLEMWSEALDQGTTTGRAVAREFFLGSEFTNLNVSNTEFLIRAYRIFMDRPINIDSDPGFLYWLEQLNSGAITREEIVDTFAASDEFAIVCRNAGFNA